MVGLVLKKFICYNLYEIHVNYILATCTRPIKLPQCNVGTQTKWVSFTLHSCTLLRSIHPPCQIGMNWSNLRLCTWHIFTEYEQILNHLIIQTSSYLRISVTYPTNDFSYSKIFACRIPCFWDRSIIVIRGKLGLVVVRVIGTYNTWHMIYNWLCHINATLYSKTCQVGHLHKLATCLCWTHIGGTGEIPFSLHISLPL
jgi:hypothetical protein